VKSCRNRIGRRKQLKNEEVSLIAVRLREREHHKGHVQSLLSLWDGLIFGHRDLFALLPRSGVECLMILGSLDPAIKEKQIKEALE
jgi:hypothetical protein